MKKLPNPAPLTLERRRFSYQAGLLAYASSIPPPSRKYMQWSVWRFLHIYSDRFAQDFHLIPFSVRIIHILSFWILSIRTYEQKTDSTLYLLYMELYRSIIASDMDTVN